MIARVFPRRTKASPDDALAYFGPPDLFSEADEVHVSVAFTYDLPRAEQLAEQWRHVAPVKVGGPATGERGEDFIPGRYLKSGYVITSRGCPNHCWFCSVWKREGQAVRELPITDGWNLLDDNILACSRPHIDEVFAMLKRQPVQAQLTGGLEAARLQDWHVAALVDLNPKQMFFAYDTPDDWEPLVDAARRLFTAEPRWVARKTVRAYCLIGFPGDTFSAAEDRLRRVLSLGIVPMATAYRKNGVEKEWQKFQRAWARPALMRVSNG